MNDLLSQAAAHWSAWIAAASWQVALMVLLVAAVTLAARRASARFRYLMWLLVLVKLFTPPSLGSEWGLGRWVVAPVQAWGRAAAGRQSLSLAVPPSASAPAPASREAAAPIGEVDEGARVSTDSAIQISDAVQPPPSSGSPRSAMDWLALGWLAGVAAFLGLILVRYALALRMLRRADEVEEGPLRVTLERLALGVGAPAAPRLLLSEHVSSPFLLGVLSPCIVLPAALPSQLDPAELENVMLHELMHWRRRDLWAGWLQAFGQALFWFHPLVWLAGAQLRHERECACDEAVLATGRSEPRQYGRSLLQVLLAAGGRSSASLGFLGIFERNARLQRRLEDIMNPENHKRRFGWPSRLFILLFTLACLPMASVTSRSQQGAPAGEKTAAVNKKISEDQGTITGIHAKITEAQKQIGALKDALDIFEVDNGRYPMAGEGLRALLNAPTGIAQGKWKGPYIKPDVVPLTDPWGNEYRYASPGESGGKPSVRSAGPDGVFRTEDDITDSKAAGNMIRESSPATREAAPVAPGASGSALDRLLTEDQRLFNEWTETRFRSFFDTRTFPTLTPAEREQMEAKLIDTLRGPKNREYYEAINTLAALKSHKAIPELLKIATDRRELDCRDRWMAIRALGLIGDPSVVPDLIHLVYYPNTNTHFMAQIALVRLTGQNFGLDYKKWVAWWNAQGKEPKLSEEQIPWVKEAKYLNLDSIRESDRKFIDQVKAQKTSESAAPAADAPAKKFTPSMADLKYLNEDQLLYVRWTEQTFGNILDPGQYLAGGNPDEKEAQWLATLEKPESRACVEAINGLAALKCAKAVKPLQRLAAEPVEKDNRCRWMAVRALGILGDKSVVPALIPLVYHYNMNTRLWAQITLARLTGQNFGYDAQAWGKWWNGQGGKPAFAPAPVEWAKSPEMKKYADPAKQVRDDRSSLDRMKDYFQQPEAEKKPEAGKKEESQRPAGIPPRILATSPAAGQKGVKADLTEISVTFDRDMSTRSWSWTGGGEYFPPNPEQKRPFWRDTRTCVLPVKLEAGHFYRVGINAQSFHGFQSEAGVPVAPTAIYFTTQGAGAELDALTEKPTVVKMEPENGARDVDPKLTELRVTFSAPMGPDYSWCGGGSNFPEKAEGGRTRWSEDRKTCILPVRLRPGWDYRLWLNSPSFNNFQNAGGVPLEPVAYTFSTAKEAGVIVN